MPEPTTGPAPATLADCHATFDGRTFMVADGRIERHWELVDGLLYPTSVIDRGAGGESGWPGGRMRRRSVRRSRFHTGT